MFLGLDLRGGVYFLMQVDMKSALTKRAEALTGDIRTLLRDKNIRHAGVTRVGNNVEIRFRDPPTLAAAHNLLADQLPDLDWIDSGEGSDLKLAGSLKPAAARRVQDTAITQNITTLHNRVNELGVNDPVIQQQGADRVVVQLPGVQDTARAKDIIGRTATLELRMVDDSAEAIGAVTGAGPVPLADERFTDRDGSPLIVKRQVVITGDNLVDAQPNFDGQTHEPIISLTLDAKGARQIREVSRDNVGKRLAILLFEKGKGEVITAPRINSELGAHFQITGRMTVAEANDQALLLRAGSLAAPMDIIEERTIGPSLGAENITKGFHSVVFGFAAIALFMCCYYLLFGVISTLALAFNLLLLLALLSMLQATLSLPGIAAIALTLGMAIDANVLINERVREELRAGAAPQVAIHTGYERAFATILDSNVTTLIAGPRAARVRLRAGARLRGRALPGHPDLDVLGGDVLARPGEPLVRAAEEAQEPVDRTDLEAQGQGRIAGQRLIRNRPWNSSGSSATSRSCGMRWCSTSSRSSPSSPRCSSWSRAACTSRPSSPAAP